MLTFLDLVNDFITETGANGGQLLTSTGGGTLAPGANTPGQGSSTLAPEVAKIVHAIADADYEIQSLHHNWKFLWRQFRQIFAVGQDWLATPVRLRGVFPSTYSNVLYTLRTVDRDSLTVNYTSQTAAFRPRFMEWRQFEAMWQSHGAKNASDTPTNWTLTPGGNPLVSHTSLSGMPYQYECWIRPRRMSADGDCSPLLQLLVNTESANITALPSTPRLLATPSTSASLESDNPVFNSSLPTSQLRYESCRIILTRAKIIMAEAEGATEVMQGALAEYQDLLEELRADQLPGMETDRMSQSDVSLVVTCE